MKRSRCSISDHDVARDDCLTAGKGQTRHRFGQVAHGQCTSSSSRTSWTRTAPRDRIQPRAVAGRAHHAAAVFVILGRRSSSRSSASSIDSSGWLGRQLGALGHRAKATAVGAPSVRAVERKQARIERLERRGRIPGQLISLLKTRNRRVGRAPASAPLPIVQRAFDHRLQLSAAACVPRASAATTTSMRVLAKAVELFEAGGRAPIGRPPAVRRTPAASPTPRPRCGSPCAP